MVLRRARWAPLAILLVAATASGQDGFRSTAADSIPLSPLHHLAFGDASSAQDDCAYAELQDTTGATATAPNNFDLRWVPCVGRDPFSLVLDNDSAEKSYPAGTGNTAPAVNLVYGDANGNGHYDVADPLYLTTATAPTLAPTSSATSFSIRLVAYGNASAGRFLLPSDPDFASFRSGVKALTGSLAYWDGDNSASVSPPDRVYLFPLNGPGYAAGRPIPASAVRLYPQEAPPTSSSSTSSASTSSTTSASGPPGATTVTVTQPPDSSGPGAATKTLTLSRPAPGPAFVGIGLVLLASAWLAARRRDD